MIEFDLDEKGYLSICDKGAFDMVDAEIILAPNEVDELKKALIINVVVVSFCQCTELNNYNDEIMGYDTCIKCDKPINR